MLPCTLDSAPSNRRLMKEQSYICKFNASKLNNWDI